MLRFFQSTTHPVLIWMIALVVVLLCVQLVLVLLFRPSHDRVWELGQEQLPHITFADDGRVSIDGFRNFDWAATGTTPVRYEQRTYTLAALETVDVYISHFDDFEGLAHIFLSFGFEGGEYVVVSFETRREVDEEFSPTLGILRQFEIVYVVGSEEDVVGLRTDVRGERVYLYPTKASPKQAQALFRAIAADINDIYAHPRMYNTFTHNCTNEITRRVEDIADVRFPYSWKSILPGYFDEVLYDLGIIATDAPFVDIKHRHYIDNDTVNRYRDTYSIELREQVTS